MKVRNFYSNDFKQEVLDKVKSGIKATDVASAYAIRVELIYKWASNKVDSNPSSIEIGRLSRENRTLKELLGELLIENKRFKKNLYGKHYQT